MEKAVGSAFFKAAILIEGGIERIEIAAVQMILRDAESIGKTLIVNDLTLTQIAQGITNVGIIAKPDEVVVGDARLLFC